MLLILNLLRLLVQDIQRDKSRLSDVGIFLSRICVKQGFNHKVNVWVLNIRQGKCLDNALFGFAVVY